MKAISRSRITQIGKKTRNDYLNHFYPVLRLRGDDDEWQRYGFSIEEEKELSASIHHEVQIEGWPAPMPSRSMAPDLRGDDRMEVDSEEDPVPQDEKQPEPGPSNRVLLLHQRRR